MLPETDARLLEQIRSGDAEAGGRLIREHYADIYRYLLYLTGQPEVAEDLTQETLLQAWQHLDTFQGRASLRTWLHRIARREFLEALRRRRTEASLEELAEVSAPCGSGWTDVVELRVLLDRLPFPEREVVLLHYLEGYSSSEVARIVDAPAGTVRYRLAQARERLRQELGEDDLAYVNEPLAPMRQWAWLPLEQMYALELRLSLGREAKEESMERREFLRQAAGGAVGLVMPEAGKEVMDSRLTQKVTLAVKATALSDLCEQLRKETSVQVAAGASVADEKVTLFCRQMPLRDVMRQLSRPFGYAWTRSGDPGAYRYERMQDLRSQLLEEELRNRDRHTALLALEKDVERYRPYLDLSPDEALARSKTASPQEKKLLERLATEGWGPVQMYFRLSHQDMAALRAGQEIHFSQEPKPGERPLPPDVARGVLQSWRDSRVVRRQDGLSLRDAAKAPDGLPVTVVPEVRAKVELFGIEQGEPGRFTFGGASTIFSTGDLPKQFNIGWSAGPLASGRSLAVLQPKNAAANARLANEPSLRSPVTVRLQTSIRLISTAAGELMEQATTADVLEALHHATGVPIVADYYTRLFPVSTVSVQNMPLFDALSHLGDAMRMRWTRDPQGSWLQFRSTSYFHDRVKEVPNHLLSRWAEARQKHGTLTLDDLVEIAGLSDAQLNAQEMAEGARLCFGLAEWDVARSDNLREHLRYLAGFTPAQRHETMSGTGLALTRMPLTQQQRFLALALSPDDPPLFSLEELAGATLRVDYTVPGWYELAVPDPAWRLWLAPVTPGRQGSRAVRPPVREQTREAALLAARRLDPQTEEAQIVPTTLKCIIVYIPGSSNARAIHRVGLDHNLYTRTW
jgi:RNA polymerase sigma-70 factor (ECF subfamily)